MKKNYNRKISLITVLIFILSLTFPNILTLINIDISNNIIFIIQIIIYMIVIMINKDNIKNELNKEVKAINLLKHSVISYLILIVSTTLVNYFIVNSFNVNLETNLLFSEYLKNYPITFIILLFLSPLYEVLFMTISLKNIIKDEKIYLILSSIIYGIISVIFSIKVPLQSLFIISYSIFGFAISYLYLKTKNIGASFFLKSFQTLTTFLICIGVI